MGSAVITVTRLLAEHMWNWGLIPSGGGFSFSLPRLDLRTIQQPVKWVPVALCPGLK